MPQFVSILSHPAKAGRILKDAWHNFTHLRLGDGISDLAELGGEFLSGVAMGISGYLIVEVLKNKNLKTSQKILPTIGLGIAIALAVPAAVAVLAGASALVPPFMFVASVGASIRNLATYISERRERNNLRKEMISKENLVRSLDKLGLSKDKSDDIHAPTFTQRDIYQRVVQIQKAIDNHPNLTQEQKEKLTLRINRAVENFSKDGNKGQPLLPDLISLLPGPIKAEFKERVDELDKIHKQVKGDIVHTYTFAQQDIYQRLYHIRQQIIHHPKLTLAQKKEYVARLNKAIENFSKDGNKGLYYRLDLVSHLPVAVREDFKKQEDELNRIHEHYQQACSHIQKVGLSKSTLKAINDYKFTREKVVSQDLPEAIKRQILASLEKEKFKQDDVKLLYAQIGNHYLNVTADEQLKALDDNFMKHNIMPHFSEEQCRIIQYYYQGPRDAMTTLNEIKQGVPFDLSEEQVAIKEKLQKFFRELIENPDSAALLDDLANLRQDLLTAGWASEELLDGLQAQLAMHQNHVAAFDRLQLETTLKMQIKAYQQSSLAQHANLGLQFEPPRVEFDLKKNNLVHKATDYLEAKKDRLLHKEDSSQDPEEEVVDSLVQARQMATPDEAKQKIKANKKALRDDFHQRYKNTFDVLGKKERLRFLEKAVPRRLLNVFSALGIAAISLVTSVIIPAIFSPAAPAAVAATVALGAVSGTITVMACANSIKIATDSFKSERRVNVPKDTVKMGVAPSIERDEKKQTRLQKAAEEHARKAEKKERKKAAQLEASQPSKLSKLLAKFNSLLGSSPSAKTEAESTTLSTTSPELTNGFHAELDKRHEEKPRVSSSSPQPPTETAEPAEAPIHKKDHPG